MIPVTRKELYLNKIVGNDDYSVPEKPISEEELFFAEILGEAVQAPEPLTRYQMYLAKIAGRDIEIPYPETRLEYFLAKAAGEEIDIPTPLTREEIFWSNYPVIVDFEVEGIPPLTYKAKAGALKDYRIYGNTAGGEAVGELEETGEHAGEYKVPVTVSDGADTQTIPIYLTEQIKKVGDEAEYIDYGEQKQHRVRKNELKNTATSQSINGLTFMVNTDKSITVNGTATETARLLLGGIRLIKNVPYKISGCPSGGSINTYRLNPRYTTGSVLIPFIDTGNGSVYTSENDMDLNIHIYVQSGYTCDNLTFYPMIRKADIEDDTYNPYITNTELDVTLPALPVLSGTNTLTVGTEVQPSKVYIKGEKEREDT